jgi:hypothetical protein
MNQIFLNSTLICIELLAIFMMITAIALIGLVALRNRNSLMTIENNQEIHEVNRRLKALEDKVNGK